MSPAGAVTIHSIVILLMASICTTFFNNPYVPKDNANIIETIGNSPILSVIYNTPMNANKMASHSNLLNLSFKKISASKMLTSGFI